MKVWSRVLAAGGEPTISLDKFKVPDREKNKVLTAISDLKGDIVGH